MHRTYPGKIKTFDPITQTATVELCREEYHTAIDVVYQKVYLPQLEHVPVHFPQCGGYSLTFPIKAGDNCLVLFCDAGYDHWLYHDKNEIGTYSTGVPRDGYFRDGDLQDSLCIVGFNPTPRAIPNFSATDVELRNVDRGQRITLKPTGVIEVISQTELDVTVPTVKVNASSLVEVTAPNTNITGNVNVTGDLHVTGTIISDTEVTAKTVNLSTHRHNNGPLPDA